MRPPPVAEKGSNKLVCHSRKRLFDEVFFENFARLATFIFSRAYARIENFGYRKRGFPLLWNSPFPYAFFTQLSLRKES